MICKFSDRLCVLDSCFSPTSWWMGNSVIACGAGEQMSEKAQKTQVFFRGNAGHVRPFPAGKGPVSMAVCTWCYSVHFWLVSLQ